MEAGEAAARILLDLADPPTAIFAVNDNNAIGVMAVAAARGLRIPDHLSLIGYKDIPVVSKLPVPLTTIREPFNLIARGAIDLLLDERPLHAQPRTDGAAGRAEPGAGAGPAGPDRGRPAPDPRTGLGVW